MEATRPWFWAGCRTSSGGRRQSTERGADWSRSSSTGSSGARVRAGRQAGREVTDRRRPAEEPKCWGRSCSKRHSLVSSIVFCDLRSGGARAESQVRRRKSCVKRRVSERRDDSSLSGRQESPRAHFLDEGIQRIAVQHSPPSGLPEACSVSHP